MRYLILPLLFFSVLICSSCGDNQRKNLPVPPPGVLADAEQIARGATLFKAHCAECHGSIGEGRTQRAARFNPQAPDFHEKRYRNALPGYLYLRIKKGRTLEPFLSAGSVMPAWEPYLEEAEIWALVAYLRYRSQP